MPSPTSENTWKIRPFAETLLALSFLTRLPIPFVRTLDMPPLAQAMRFFPLAGALIGCISAGVLIGANMLGLPSLLAAVIALSVGTLVTGALHEDGLADVADGFGGGKTREARLEIMRDSRIGTYGTIALVLSYIGRAAPYNPCTFCWSSSIFKSFGRRSSVGHTPGPQRWPFGVCREAQPSQRFVFAHHRRRWRSTCCRLRAVA
jgi:hypothetical protein